MVDERLEPSFRLTKEVVKLHVIRTRLSLRLVRTTDTQMPTRCRAVRPVLFEAAPSNRRSHPA